MSDNSNLATFAGGCFWGVEHYFKKEFGSKLLKTSTGYANGNTDKPSYREVCSGSSGYAEAVQLAFDPSKVSYEQLVTFFWRIHDPTTLNRQGNDVGTQYRSGVYYHTDEQRQVAEKVKEQVQKHFKNPITTEIVPFKNYFKAEDYHQDYLSNNPGGYCNHGFKW
ncbi:peptide methionine sulfoxide reductase [Conidiobolus coronatus NRRL 28638]|uniref:peptide-methionine (S)-S-oxide reductase n=1 Tax=Conidiobolus coronatus (strain ATCC 28846 / CBS 209.66 / NRRL 28638) TaxID=796925 RepID=A0A137PAX7_CONC2|nr:peptide methionine sulfoxide reductase [Conidiobolus coronatus NRRL 28638]|eukprot:KXN72170.1 peptide methionine sulfoxide reductase [Conidiobolus coronatus NRRL 28638]